MKNLSFNIIVKNRQMVYNSLNLQFYPDTMNKVWSIYRDFNPSFLISLQIYEELWDEYENLTTIKPIVSLGDFDEKS